MKTNIKYLVVVLLLITYGNTAKFNVNSTSNCQDFSKGYCIKWTQIGTVEEQSGACFPGITKVITQQRGPQHLSQVHIGDHILTQKPGCKQCEPYYTEIIGWLHRNPTQVIPYLEIFTKNTQKFYSSHYHNIATEKGQYLFAKDLQGKLLGQSEDQEVVWSYPVTKRGVFSPITKSSNYFILKEGSQQKVLVHNYAHIKNPVAYEPIVKSIITTWETLWGKPTEDMLIHPAAEWMKNNFHFLLDGAKTK